jgi:hypothetical protein
MTESRAWGTAALARVRSSEPPKKPRVGPLAPGWFLVACDLNAFVQFGLAVRRGHTRAAWLAFIVLVYSWALWVWWQWRRWCEHSGEPFPRYGPVDFSFMALSSAAILLGWTSELLGRDWASRLLR